jgi:hypothetical protein
MSDQHPLADHRGWVQVRRLRLGTGAPGWRAVDPLVRRARRHGHLLRTPLVRPQRQRAGRPAPSQAAQVRRAAIGGAAATKGAGV